MDLPDPEEGVGYNLASPLFATRLLCSTLQDAGEVSVPHAYTYVYEVYAILHVRTYVRSTSNYTHLNADTMRQRLHHAFGVWNLS